MRACVQPIASQFEGSARLQRVHFEIHARSERLRSPEASAPGLGADKRPHLLRDSALISVHICAGTRPTSAPGLTRLSGSDRISGVFTYLRAGGAVGTRAPINDEIRVLIDTCA